MIDDFDPDYASPSQWARLYRACGLQVVPAKSPSEVKSNESYKRPVIAWRQHEKTLVDDAQFEQWYGAGGEFSRRQSMGVLTGQCSGNLLVIDLDTHKNPHANVWWEGIHADHAGGILPETATQTTGGGGKQYFFRAPAGVILPTVKTPIGVDFRGQGGFAMLPPSKHESGNQYEWDDGFAPHEVGISDAPEWLLEEVAALAAKYGAGGEASASGPKEKTATPSHATDAFGNIVDGREDYMHRMIFAAVLNAYRDCPIMPPADDQLRLMRACFQQYELHVKSRINEPGTPNHVLLEREGRGLTLFTQKWKETIAQWDGKISRFASQPPAPKEGERKGKEGEAEGEVKSDATSPFADDFTAPAGTPEMDTFRLLSIKEILARPDPVYLIERLLMESSMAFIYGAPGIGKSFVALDICLSVATGRPKWWGRKISRKAPVLYISSEGVADLKLRIEAWSQRTGTPVSDDDIEFFLLEDDVNFMDENSVNMLLRTIVQRYQNEPPALVVIDTVSRTLPGADENLQKDMTLYIATCKRIQVAFKCTVMGVHHSSKNGGNMRGSSVFDGAADTVLQVTVDEETGQKLLVARKIKSARDGWQEPFVLTEVLLGIDRSSLVAEPAPNEETQPEGGFGSAQETGFQMVDGRKWPAKETCQAIVRDIGRAWDDGRPWSNKKQSKESGRYAPDLIANRYGVPQETAEIMVRQWLMNDVISLDMKDAHKKLWGLRVVNGIP